MRIAVVSDIHGNLAAFEAVLADLERVGADLVVQGGDLAFNGPHPAECVARIRELGWPGVVGNTDRVLWDQSGVFDAVRTMFEKRSQATLDLLGEDNLAWLRRLPGEWRRNSELAVVHASPGDLWRAAMPDDPDGALRERYGGLGAALVVYGHIHLPFVRSLPDGLTVANSGSVGMPFDGDPRAGYLLIEGGRPQIRRVEYDVERHAADLVAGGYPDAELLAAGARTGRFMRPD